MNSPLSGTGQTNHIEHEQGADGSVAIFPGTENSGQLSQSLYHQSSVAEVPSAGNPTSDLHAANNEELSTKAERADAAAHVSRQPANEHARSKKSVYRVPRRSWWCREEDVACIQIMNDLALKFTNLDRRCTECSRLLAVANPEWVRSAGAIKSRWSHSLNYKALASTPARLQETDQAFGIHDDKTKANAALSYAEGDRQEEFMVTARQEGNGGKHPRVESSHSSPVSHANRKKAKLHPATDSFHPPDAMNSENTKSPCTVTLDTSNCGWHIKSYILAYAHGAQPATLQPDQGPDTRATTRASSAVAMLASLAHRADPAPEPFHIGLPSSPYPKPATPRPTAESFSTLPKRQTRYPGLSGSASAWPGHRSDSDSSAVQQTRCWSWRPLQPSDIPPDPLCSDPPSALAGDAADSSPSSGPHASDTRSNVSASAAQTTAHEPATDTTVSTVGTGASDTLKLPAGCV
ncbi:hypothetical protein MBLNU459_g2541t1 [Dothideomycetes sp. NU459]